jgi:hypothetical protein
MLGLFPDDPLSVGLVWLLKQINQKHIRVHPSLKSAVEFDLLRCFISVLAGNVWHMPSRMNLMGGKLRSSINHININLEPLDLYGNKLNVKCEGIT